jgi:hypothetical protein
MASSFFVCARQGPFMWGVQSSADSYDSPAIVFTAERF